MIKLFKNVDEKLVDIGFTKVRDDEYGVDYERTVDKYEFVHKVSIVRKTSGRPIYKAHFKKYDGNGNWDYYDMKEI